MAQQPMYQQIADDLRKQIDDGVIAPGSQLPTEIDLREHYGASRNTIRDAIKRLISQGLIETRPGQGTFVTTRIDPFVTVLTADPKTGLGGDTATYLSAVSEVHRVPLVTTPKVEVLAAPAQVARRLRIAETTQVVSRHRERYIDGIPWSLETSYYPMKFITGGAPKLLMAEDIAEGTVRYLADTLGLQQIGYRDWITARVPELSEQIFFRIAHDATIIEIFRSAFDQRGKPMRLTVTVYPADRNQFIVDVGDELPDPRYDEEPEE
ncbi:MAG: GntR family transcriptional regulator [Trebonia sp.]